MYRHKLKNTVKTLLKCEVIDEKFFFSIKTNTFACVNTNNSTLVKTNTNVYCKN